MKSFIKRTLAALLSLLLIAALFPAPAVAWADEGEEQEQSVPAVTEPVTFEIEAPQEEQVNTPAQEPTAENEAVQPAEAAAPEAEPAEEQPAEAEQPQEEAAEEQPREEETEEATQEESAEEETEEEETEEETQEEVVLEYRSLTEGKVTVTGLVPADAALCVTELRPESYEQLAGRGRAVIFAYDISIISAGAEWQPTEPLSVKISALAEAGEEMEILHIEDGSVLPQLVATVQADELSGELEFAASGFSVYLGTVSEYMVFLCPGSEFNFYSDPDCTLSLGGEVIIENGSTSSFDIYLKALDGFEIVDCVILNEDNSESPATISFPTGDEVYYCKFTVPYDITQNQVIKVATNVKESSGLNWVIYHDYNTGELTMFISSLPIEAGCIEGDGSTVINQGVGFNWIGVDYWMDIQAVRVGNPDNGDIVCPGTTSCWFGGMNNLCRADLFGLDTSKVTDMSYMFCGCCQLIELYGLENFNTARVTNFSHMFENVGYCGALPVGGWNTESCEDFSYMFCCSWGISEIDVSGWVTSSAKSLAHMFECTGVRELAVSGWDTSKVINMQGTFTKACNIENLDVSYWDTSKVKDMSYLFYGMEAVQYLDVSGFNTEAVVTMSGMFGCCQRIQSLDLSGFNTSRVTDMSHMFYCCSMLEGLDLRSFNTSNVTSMAYMFCGCSLEVWSLLDDLDSSSLVDMSGMFEGCTGLTYFDFGCVNTSKLNYLNDVFRDCTNLVSADLNSLRGCDLRGTSGMFSGCTSLEFVDLSCLNTSRVEDMSIMFQGCSSLRDLDLNCLNTASAINMSNMFSGCSSLTNLDLSSFNMANVQSAESMISRCTGLTSMNLSNLYTPNLVNASNMFSGCSNLKSLDLSGWYAPEMRNANYLFAECTSLEYFDIHGATLPKVYSCEGYTGMNTLLYFLDCRDTIEYIDLSDLDISTISSFRFMFNGCNRLKTVCLQGIQAPNVTDMRYMFYSCSSLTELDLSSLTASKVYDMSYMFEGCYNLRSLDISSFDTSAATNMNSMFSSCYALTSLDLSHFNTSNVTGMSNMFKNCESLSSLDISSFNTEKVGNMSYMFYSCRSLTSLDVSGFNTKNTGNMSYMFQGCYSLQELDVSGFNTANVTNMSYMFYGYKGSELDVSGFNTSKVNSFRAMFIHCDNLQELDVSGFNTANATDMSEMFEYCSALQSLDGSHFNTEKVTNMEYMFYCCSALTSVDVSGFNTSSVTKMNRMFNSCSSLTELDVSGWQLPKLTECVCFAANCNSLRDFNMSGWYAPALTKLTQMLRDCSSLEHVDMHGADFSSLNLSNSQNFSGLSKLKSMDMSNVNLSSATSLSYLLSGCSSLKELNLSGLNAPNVTDLSGVFSSCRSLEAIDLSVFSNTKPEKMSSMFSACNALKSIDLSCLNTENLTRTDYLFSSCNSLTSFNFSGFNTSKVTNMQGMFQNCSSLSYIDLSTIDTSCATNMSAMFQDCSSLSYIDLSTIDTSSATNLSSMFYYCSSLKELDVSGFNTENVTSLNAMFQGCSGLRELNVSGFNTAKVTDMGHMFAACSGLKWLDVSGLNTENVTRISSMFYGCNNLEYIDVSGFDTGKCVYMNSMFYQCYNLKTVDVSGFNTENVTNISHIFYHCGARVLDVSNWNTAKFTDVRYMFCSSAVSYLDLSGWDLSKVTKDTSYFVNYATKVCRVSLSASAATKIGSNFNGWLDENGVVCYDIPAGTAGTYYKNAASAEMCTRFEPNAEGEPVAKMPLLSSAASVYLCDYAPSRAGYSLICWNTEPDRSGDDYYPTDIYTAPASGSTLYAVWEPLTEITLSYLGNGGATPAGNDSLEYTAGLGESLRVKANTFSNPGYSFQHWENEEGTAYLPNSLISLQGDTSLTAVWAKNPELCFNSNNELDQSFTANLVYGTVYYFKLRPFTYEGFELAGWSEDPGCSPDDEENLIKIGSTKTLMEDKSYYAIWTPKLSFTLHSNLEPDQAVEMSFFSYDLIPGNVFNIADKTVEQWNIYPDGSGSEEGQLWQPGMSAGEIPDGTELYAIWYSDQTVNYHRNIEGEEDTFFTAELPYGDFTLPHIDVDNPGHWFNGWNTEPDGTGKSYAAGAQACGYSDFYAKWAPNPQITYYINLPDRSELFTESSEKNGNYEIQDCPWTNDDKLFLGWSTAPERKDGEWHHPGATCTISEDLILYAIWQKDINITLHNNIPDRDDETLVCTGHSDEEIWLPQAPFEREGYTIAAWLFTHEDNTDYCDTVRPAVFEDSVDLYAVWEEGCSISFLFNLPEEYKYQWHNGEYQLFRENDEVTVPLAEHFGMNLPGIKFVEWNTLPDGTGNSYAPESTFVITENITLYGIWAKKCNTLTLHSNLEEEDQTIQKIIYIGADCLVGEAPWPNEDYAFACWSTEPDGSGNCYGGKDRINLNEDMDLYAQWTKVVPVIFVEPVTGEKYEQLVPVDCDCPLADVTFKNPGFKLVGWNTDPEGGKDAFALGQTVNINSELILFAQWETASYYVVFDPGKAEFQGDICGTMPVQIMDCNSEYQLYPLSYTRIGYAFDGWMDDNGNMYRDGETVKNLALEQGETVRLYACWREAPSYQIVIPASIEINPDGESDELLISALMVNFCDRDIISISLNYSGTLSYIENDQLIESLTYTMQNSQGECYRPGEDTQLREFHAGRSSSQYSVMGLTACLDSGQEAHYAGSYMGTATFVLDVLIGK